MATPCTPDRAVELLCRLARGRSLKSVCRDPDMPSVPTVHNWARRDPVFADHLQAARADGPRARARGGANPRKYSDALARGICAALADGFSLKDICASPAVPVTPHGVHRWVRTRPDFAAAYAEATRPRPSRDGLVIGRGRRGACSPERMQAIIERLHQGRALADICRDPDMPPLKIVNQWRRYHLHFELALQAARRFQLDLLLDDVLAAADAGRRPGPQALRIVNGLTHRGVLPYAAGRGDGQGAPWPHPAAPGIGHNSKGR